MATTEATGLVAAAAGAADDVDAIGVEEKGSEKSALGKDKNANMPNPVVHRGATGMCHATSMHCLLTLRNCAGFLHFAIAMRVLFCLTKTRKQQ